VSEFYIVVLCVIIYCFYAILWREWRFTGSLNVRLRQFVTGVRPCESIVEAMTECVGVACATTTWLLRFLRSRVRSALKAPSEERHA